MFFSSFSLSRRLGTGLRPLCRNFILEVDPKDSKYIHVEIHNNNETHTDIVKSENSRIYFNTMVHVYTGIRYTSVVNKFGKIFFIYSKIALLQKILTI